MRHVDGLYTQRFNRSHGRDGPLFRGRYRAILIDADEYLAAVVRYIHLNPVEAKVVKLPEEYRWSNDIATLGEKGCLNFLYGATSTELAVRRFLGRAQAARCPARRNSGALPTGAGRMNIVACRGGPHRHSHAAHAAAADPCDTGGPSPWKRRRYVEGSKP
jgi:putative transposase